MSIETHIEQQQRHSAEFGKLEGIFFAFSNEQFAEGMQKVGFGGPTEVDETTLVYALGNGGYIRKDKFAEFRAMVVRHKVERKNRLKDEKALLESLVYELRNHEFSYSHDDTEAIEALGLTKEEIPPEILKKAKDQCYMTVE